MPRAPARAEAVHPDTSANRLTKGRTPDVASSASVIDTVVNLCKRRGLVYQCGEIYGGTRSAWDYGPLGVELKDNIKKQWWRNFVTGREDVVGLDSSIILPRKVWEASGHVDTFTDPLVESLHTHKRYRADHLIEAYVAKHGREPANGLADINDPVTGQPGSWTEPQLFSGLMKTYLGPVDDKEGLHYLRPETAQGIFVNYKNVMTTARRKPPFGIGQIGKAFRNEITPGNFIFRTREFEQMEIEFFTKPDEADEWFKRWVEDCWDWFVDLGIDPANMRRFDVPDDERAHYSAGTIDFEYKFGFSGNPWGELMGVANRTDYDLTQHQTHSGEDLQYRDQASGEKYVPYVIEPSFGLTRSLMAFLIDAYTEDEAPNSKGGVDTRTVLKLDRRLSPFKAAVLPLSRNADLSPKARDLAAQLRKSWNVDFDDAQAIGRRYRRHDEIGTPFCITVDFDTLEDQAVTIRERDTMEQERVAIDQVEGYLAQRLIGC
ncbi:glycyl-tRNA synthetase [Dietzia sp. 2505]